MPSIKLAKHTYVEARARKSPSNNPQFDQGSRSARALISPGVFSSTGSRLWISTIRLAQRCRAVGNSGFWGNRCKHPRPGFEIRYRTLREYKPGGVGVWRRCYHSIGTPHVRSGSPSPTTFQPHTSVLGSHSSAVRVRCLRRYYVRPTYGNGSFGCCWSPVFSTIYILHTYTSTAVDTHMRTYIPPACQYTHVYTNHVEIIYTTVA